MSRGVGRTSLWSGSCASTPGWSLARCLTRLRLSRPLKPALAFVRTTAEATVTASCTPPSEARCSRPFSRPGLWEGPGVRNGDRSPPAAKAAMSPSARSLSPPHTLRPTHMTFRSIRGEPVHRLNTFKPPTPPTPRGGACEPAMLRRSRGRLEPMPSTGGAVVGGAVVGGARVGGARVERASKKGARSPRRSSSLVLGGCNARHSAARSNEARERRTMASSAGDARAGRRGGGGRGGVAATAAAAGVAAAAGGSSAEGGVGGGPLSVAMSSCSAAMSRGCRAHWIGVIVT